MSMTKKDYVRIAKALHRVREDAKTHVEWPAVDAVDTVAAVLVAEFQTDNPDFKPGLFVDAVVTGVVR